VRELFWEYLQSADGRVNEEFGVNLDIEAMLEDGMAKLDVCFFSTYLGLVTLFGAVLGASSAPNSKQL